MFAELMLVALVVCLLFCESAKEQFAHAMSIGTLLESVVMINAVKWINPNLWVRNKMRNRAIPPRYYAATTPLHLAS